MGYLWNGWMNIIKQRSSAYFKAANYFLNFSELYVPCEVLQSWVPEDIGSSGANFPEGIFLISLQKFKFYWVICQRTATNLWKFARRFLKPAQAFQGVLEILQMFAL
jgi:hypothetical protein